MLRSCRYCGKIHDSRVKCKEAKEVLAIRQRYPRDSESRKLHSSSAWSRKREAILKRDNYMCLCCMECMIGTVRQYNTVGIEVHHIVPIAEDHTKGLDDDNLISVCRLHHEMCEKGKVDRLTQKELVSKSTRRCEK